MGCKPWDIDRLSMREVVEMADAYVTLQEQPGSPAWVGALVLNVLGSQIPWTARTLLGRPPKTNG